MLAFRGFMNMVPLHVVEKKNNVCQVCSSLSIKALEIPFVALPGKKQKESPQDA